MDNKKVGNFIKQKRKEKNLTQQELGELIGISPKSVSKWECGTSFPDLVILKPLSHILNVSIDELLNGQENPSKHSKSSSPKIILIIITIIIFISIFTLLIVFHFNHKESSLTKTYKINTIIEKEDPDFLYVTLEELPTDKLYTVKLPRIICNALEENKSYKFKFLSKGNIQGINIFINSKIISIKEIE